MNTTQPRKRLFGSRFFWQQARRASDEQCDPSRDFSAGGGDTRLEARPPTLLNTGRTEAGTTYDPSTEQNCPSAHQLTTPAVAEPYLFALFAAAERRGLKPKITKVVGQVVLDVICSETDWAFVRGEAVVA